NRLELDLQIHLPIVTFLQGPSITELVDQVLTLEGPWIGEGRGQAGRDLQVGSAQGTRSMQGAGPALGTGSTQGTIPTVQVYDEKAEIAYLPLSHNQKALWFLSRLAPESAAYNLLYAARIRQQLDIPTLQRTLWGLAKRYPVLTSTYTLHNGEP